VADAAIFVGWGQVVRGREAKALAVFNEALAYTRLQQEGTIEASNQSFSAHMAATWPASCYFAVIAPSSTASSRRRSSSA
jgi:hypothetical protein